MKLKTQNTTNESSARARWNTKSHLNATKNNFMGHFDAVRAGLVLLQEEVFRGGVQGARRGGPDVCLQP